MSRSLALVALTALLWGIGASASSLTILYTNDLHARLGRLEGLAGLIERERTGDDAVLLFDVGDTWQDFRLPFYAVWGADEFVTWMNRVGYDAMALGNHDFYWGAERLAELSDRAGFPLLCANLRPSVEIVPPFTPYTFISIGDMQVLVIGLITLEYLPYPEFPWLRYIEPDRALQEILEEVGEMADVIVVLGHLSIPKARWIARAVPGIDIFLTGHSHETTLEPVKVGKTLILQAGAFGRYLGRLRLELDEETGSIRSAKGDLISTKKNPAALGRGYVKLLEVAVLIACLFLFLLV